MKRIYFVMALAFACCIAKAGDVTLSQAEGIAKAFFKEKCNKAIEPGAPRLASKGLAGMGEAAAYYVFNSADSTAFVVVAGDDKAPQILAYGTDTSFDEGNLPPGAEAFLEGYKAQIKALKGGATPAQACAVNVSGERLLTTAKWNQSYDFWWSQCPKVGTQPCHAGCVPASMAIIMRYYQWPAHGFGSHKFVSETNGFECSADFSSIDYNLADLPLDDQSSPAWTAERQERVAKLLYQCGVTTQADYDPKGTGTSGPELALYNFFGYKLGTEVRRSTVGDDAKWKEMLCEELDGGYPMIYSGSGTGGHAFICDGYDTNGMFHFNFGWSGSGNGYYYIDNIVLGESDFSNSQAAVFNLRPDYSANSSQEADIRLRCNDIDGGRGIALPDSLYRDVQFNVDLYGLKSIKPGEFTGTMALFLCDKYGRQKVQLGGTQLNAFAYATSYSKFTIYNCLLPKEADVEPTDYIALFTSTDNENWQMAASTDLKTGKVPVREMLSGSVKHLGMKLYTSSEDYGLQAERDGDIPVGKRFYVHAYKLTNLLNRQFIGEVAVFLCDEAGNQKAEIGKTTVTEGYNYRGGTYYLDFKIACTIPASATVLPTDRLMLFSKESGSEDWGVVSCDDEELSYVTSLVQPAPESGLKGDMDGDGKITMSDANAIVNIYLSGAE